MEVPGSASLDHKRLKLSTSSTVWILFFSKKKRPFSINPVNPSGNSRSLQQKGCQVVMCIERVVWVWPALSMVSCEGAP